MQALQRLIFGSVDEGQGRDDEYVVAKCGCYVVREASFGTIGFAALKISQIIFSPKRINIACPKLFVVFKQSS
jgi:hypothetical protein